MAESQGLTVYIIEVYRNLLSIIGLKCPYKLKAYLLV